MEKTIEAMRKDKDAKKKKYLELKQALGKARAKRKTALIEYKAARKAHMQKKRELKPSRKRAKTAKGKKPAKSKKSGIPFLGRKK